MTGRSTRRHACGSRVGTSSQRAGGAASRHEDGGEWTRESHRSDTRAATTCRRRRVAPRKDRPFVPAGRSAISQEPHGPCTRPPRRAPISRTPRSPSSSRGESLSRDEARAFMAAVLDGDVTPAQLGGVLLAIRVRTETTDELAGFVEAMRARVLVVDAPAGTIDTCGTGGDVHGTFNISTATSLVTAAAGVPVAKHGNRAVSSAVGQLRRHRVAGPDRGADAGGRRGLAARDRLRVPPRARRSTRACATRVRSGASSACGPRSTCAARWPIRRSSRAS